MGERVKFGHSILKEKGRVQVSSQVISSITSIRIIKKCILNYFLQQGFEDNHGTHTPFIQVLENDKNIVVWSGSSLLDLKSVESTLQEVILNPCH